MEMAVMRNRDISVYSVRFTSEDMARTRRVRARQGIDVGAIVDVDVSTGVRLLYGRELPPLPRWTACEIVRNQEVLGIGSYIVVRQHGRSRRVALGRGLLGFQGFEISHQDAHAEQEDRSHDHTDPKREDG